MNKNRNASPSVSNDSDSSEIKSSGFVAAPTGTSALQTSGEANGMILDRVVEGGLDGVENLSPSRKSHLWRGGDSNNGAKATQGWWTLRDLYWKKIKRAVA